MAKPRDLPKNETLPRTSRAALLVLPGAFLIGMGLAFAYSRLAPATPATTTPAPAAQTPAAPDGLAEDADIRKGEQALREGRLGDAIQAFDAAGQRYPDRVEPLLGLVRAFLDAKRIDDALRAANVAIQIAPKDARAYIAMGKARLAAGDLVTAEKSFAEAAALDRSNAEPVYYAGRIAAERKQFEVALAAYRRALDLDPAFLPAAHDLSTHLMDAGDFPGAEKVLTAGLARAPGNTGLQLNHARLFLKKGDAPSAVEAYAQVLPKIADMPIAQNDYGQALLLAGREEDALRAFRRAAEMDALMPDPWYGIGQIYQRRGDAAEAEKAFAVFRKNRDLRQAVRSLEFRLRNRPGDVEALVELGRLLLEAGKPKEAITRLRMALALSSEAGREHPVARQLFDQAARALGVAP